MGCATSNHVEEPATPSKKEKTGAKRPIISEEDAMKQRDERIAAQEQQWAKEDHESLLQLSQRRLLSSRSVSPSTSSLNPKISSRLFVPGAIYVEASPPSCGPGSPSVFDLLESEEDEPDTLELPKRPMGKNSRSSSYQKDTCRDSFQCDENTTSSCWRPSDAQLPGEVRPALLSDNDPMSAEGSFLHTHTDSVLHTMSKQPSVLHSLRRKIMSPRPHAL